MKDIVTVIILIVIFVSILLNTVNYCLNKSWGKVLHELCILPALIFFVCYDVMGGVTGINEAKMYYEAYKEGEYYLVDHGAFTEVNVTHYYFMFYLQIATIAFIIMYIVGCIIPMIKNKLTKE